MDSMHPDPSPPLPPSLDELRSQITRLESAHKAKGLPLSGRIIHLCHHLPVEIVKFISQEAVDAQPPTPSLNPKTPEFKPEDAAATVESLDSKWKIHARRGHTAMISGMRSLSATHEQTVVAWTGEILLAPAPPLNPPSTPDVEHGQNVPAVTADEPHLQVFAGEFGDAEKNEIEKELGRFSDVEAEVEKGKLSYVPVFVPPEVSKGHYEGYCKTTLWPLFHYLLWLDSTATVPSPDPSWIHYHTTNSLFAEKVASIYRPGDLIIVHDYHLLLAPKMIRDALSQSTHVSSQTGFTTVSPSPAVGSENKKMDWANGATGDRMHAPASGLGAAAKAFGEKLGQAGAALGAHLGGLGQLHREHAEIMIGMFVHTPWPSSEVFRCLPKRREILEGMLGADQICFQTYSYSRHFASTCIRVCGFESAAGGIDANGKVTSVSYCPIGIDVKRVSHDRDSAGVQPKIEALRTLYKDKKIVMGREKLDVAKGVYNKLQAFEKFLLTYPEWRGKVVLIQVTTPALSESPKLERLVAELVSHINGTYGSLDFTPVHHYHQAIERDEYFALLSVADLALITSLRDGMNTTSMEFILSQDKTNKSPLVLSEFMGTASSFSQALQINPHDLLGVADAINKGLTMSEEEKHQRHAELYASVVGHTSHTWAATILHKLLENVGGEHTAHQTPGLDVSTLASSYVKAKKRLMLFDYDGTLTPIVKVPSHAIPTERTRNAIAALAADPKNVVFLISGRDGDFLEEHWGGVRNIGMSAEHGSFVRAPADQQWTNMTEALDMSWMSEVEEIFRYYTERTTGSTIEVKKASITWHYRNSDPSFGEFQCKQALDLLESNLAPRRPIEVLVGKKNLEVRPLAINKGEIVKRILYENPDADFVFCAGDDKTDEDMFRSLRTIYPPGGPYDNQPTVFKAPVAVTAAYDPDEAALLPDVELQIQPENIFSTTVGPPAKKTLAGWHVTSPDEVVEAMEHLLEMTA